jgi:alpha/beta superfamily hydrolase
MNEIQVSFRSGDLTLEGLLANPGANAPAAVVCHPHPLHGGSMYNNVVDAILAAMWQAGYATLRFNFRGVGASEGEHDGGPGEVDDSVAAMTYLLAQPGVRKEGAVMAGYSFGAMVAVSAGYESAEIARIVAVALPLAMADARIPEGASKPVLLVSGDRDSYSPVAGLQALKSKIGDSARLEVVAGADHFFGGCEAELGRVIGAALAA